MRLVDFATLILALDWKLKNDNLKIKTIMNDIKHGWHVPTHGIHGNPQHFTGLDSSNLIIQAQCTLMQRANCILDICPFSLDIYDLGRKSHHIIKSNCWNDGDSILQYMLCSVDISSSRCQSFWNFTFRSLCPSPILWWNRPHVRMILLEYGPLTSWQMTFSKILVWTFAKIMKSNSWTAMVEMISAFYIGPFPPSSLLLQSEWNSVY